MRDVSAMVNDCEVHVRAGIKVFCEDRGLQPLEVSAEATRYWQEQYEKTFQKAVADGFQWERARAGVALMATKLGQKAAALALVDCRPGQTPSTISQRNAREASLLVAADPACQAAKRGGGGDWCEMLAVITGFYS